MSETYWTGLFSVLRVMVGLFLISGLGFCLTKFRVFRKDDAKSLSRVLIDLVVPAKLLVATAAGLTSETLAGTAVVILAVTVMILLGLAWSGVAGAALRDADWKRRRAVMALSSIQNAMYIPLPLILALVPAESANEATVYIGGAILATFSLQWTLGVYLLRGREDRQPSGLRETLANAITPPPVALLLGAACATIPALSNAARGTGGPAPAVLVFDAARLLGSALTPLAMLVLGMLIANCSLRSLRPGVLAIPLTYRILLAPALMLLALKSPLLNWVGPYVALVLMIESASPPATGTSIIAVRFDGDWETVSAVLLVAYLCALVTMPAWVAVVMPAL